MIKKSIIAVLLSVVLASCSTPAPQDLLRYSKVIEVPNTTKAELYNKVNIWAVSYFNNSESVIEYSDKGMGVIAGKYVAVVTISYFQYYTKQTIQIEVKDNKVRVVITEPYAKLNDATARSIGGTTVGYSPITTVEAMNPIRKQWVEVIEDIEQSINIKDLEW